ncbi:MAG: SDR family NAD(P)-dependent oxidoreductase [Acidobacteria bacterium]|nr:SDR family NAD(P)-dependent oxidoreductase [Acidobacteriota bacterium]
MSDTAQAQDAQQGRASDIGELCGQVAFVTGAARGIGRATGVALARAGADVVALNIARDIAGHPIPLSTMQDLTETVRLVEAEGQRALLAQAECVT